MWHIQVLQPQGSPMQMTNVDDSVFGVFNLTYMKLSDTKGYTERQLIESGIEKTFIKMNISHKFCSFRQYGPQLQAVCTIVTDVCMDCLELWKAVGKIKNIPESTSPAMQYDAKNAVGDIKSYFS